MKTLFFTLSLFILMPVFSPAQQAEADPSAVLILDRMSAMVGSLSSCSFTLHVSNDVPDNTFFVPVEGIGLIKQFRVSEVFLSGPDKMLVNTRGDKGHVGYWYNGQRLAWYSYDENNYAVVDAPDSTVNMMYELNNRYGIEFPAADFFNPFFTDDLLDHHDRLYFLGTSTVADKPCYHLIAAAEDKIVQLWIADDAMMLPVKMVIVYRDREENPQYEATFSDWKINPDLPETIFDFLPPPSASKIAVASKNTE